SPSVVSMRSVGIVSVVFSADSDGVGEPGVLGCGCVLLAVACCVVDVVGGAVAPFCGAIGEQAPRTMLAAANGRSSVLRRMMTSTLRGRCPPLTCRTCCRGVWGRAHTTDGSSVGLANYSTRGVAGTAWSVTNQWPKSPDARNLPNLLWCLMASFRSLPSDQRSGRTGTGPVP